MKKIVFILAITLSGIVNAQDYGDSLVTYNFHSNETIEFYILNYINVEREKAGLPKFEIDTMLHRLARRHSEWMCKTSIYVHSSDIRTPDPGQHRRINYAENCMMYHCIRYGTHKEKAEMCVGAWMSSSAHQNNILDSKSKTIGVGFAQKRNNEYPINQMEQYFTIMLK
jgi:uncharacterized protein YkwD